MLTNSSSARVTEDVGTRYRVELTLAGEGADLVLLFDSRVVFLMLFSALRAHDVASQFDFTKERQRGASAAGTPKGWRWLAALAGAAAGFALYWHRLDPYDRNTATLGTYAVGAFIALVALGCLMGLFHALYDAGRSEEPLTLAGILPGARSGDHPGRPAPGHSHDRRRDVCGSRERAEPHSGRRRGPSDQRHREVARLGDTRPQVTTMTLQTATRTYYDVLGVPRNAKLAFIRRRYITLAQDVHPDRFSEPAERVRKSEEFKAVNEAWEVLSDRVQRGRYDSSLDGGTEFRPAEGTGKTAEAIFGDAKRFDFDWERNFPESLQRMVLEQLKSVKEFDHRVIATYRVGKNTVGRSPLTAPCGVNLAVYLVLTNMNLEVGIVGTSETQQGNTRYTMTYSRISSLYLGAIERLDISVSLAGDEDSFTLRIKRAREPILGGRLRVPGQPVRFPLGRGSLRHPDHPRRQERRPEVAGRPALHGGDRGLRRALDRVPRRAVHDHGGPGPGGDLRHPRRGRVAACGRPRPADRVLPAAGRRAAPAKPESTA